MRNAHVYMSHLDDFQHAMIEDRAGYIGKDRWMLVYGLEQDQDNWYLKVGEIGQDPATVKPEIYPGDKWQSLFDEILDICPDMLMMSAEIADLICA